MQFVHLHTHSFDFSDITSHSCEYCGQFPVRIQFQSIDCHNWAFHSLTHSDCDGLFPASGLSHQGSFWHKLESANPGAEIGPKMEQFKRHSIGSGYFTSCNGDWIWISYGFVVCGEWIADERQVEDQEEEMVLRITAARHKERSGCYKLLQDTKLIQCDWLFFDFRMGGLVWNRLGNDDDEDEDKKNWKRGKCVSLYA